MFGSAFLEKFHQIFWVSGSDFHLPVAPGVKKPMGITESKKFSSEIHKISKKFWRILKNSQFYCVAKTLLNTPHLGWCSAVNFWRNSTRFAGFLAVIFTSQWLLASRNHWGLRKAKNSLQKFINFEKKSGEF